LNRPGALIVAENHGIIPGVNWRAALKSARLRQPKLLTPD